MTPNDPPVPASPWKAIRGAPIDGTPVIVNNGQASWISSRIIGKHALRNGDGMPLNGRDWYMGNQTKPPLRWMSVPKDTYQP